MEAGTKRQGMPAVERRHVPRPRLTRLLDETAATAIVLNAPAGFGKTRLAAEWTAGRENAAWQRVTRADADLAAFSSGLADAAGRLVSGAGERLRSRLGHDEAPELAVRQLAELFAEDLADWPEDAWLVVDDYELVADSAAVEEFVDWLLTLAPMRLLVTTRRRPSWASARRVLYGEILELGAGDLAFTDDEARAVLDGHPAEAVQAVLTEAEGWPALVGLARLSEPIELPRGRIAGALYRYFAEEVVRREPPDVQRFMLVASVPPAVSPAIAEDVLGLPGAGPIFATLAEKGLLHESGQAEYAFHRLLRDFLRQKLEAEDRETFLAVAGRAAEEARAARRWDEALELAQATGDERLWAGILADATPELLAGGKLETVDRWLTRLGRAARAEPTLVRARAEVLLRRGALVEAGAIAHDLARSLPLDHPSASALWYVAGRAFHQRSAYAAALECLACARAAARNDTDVLNAYEASIGVAAEVSVDELDRLIEAFARDVPDDLDSKLMLAAGRALLASRGRSFAGVWEALEPVVALAGDAGDPLMRSRALEAAAYLANARADYARGGAIAAEVLELCSTFRLGETRTALCLCCAASAEIGLRRFDAAAARLAEGRPGAATARHVSGEHRCLEMKLALATGRAQTILDHSEPLDDDWPGQLSELAGLLAVAAAAVGDPAAAREHAAVALELEGSIEGYFYARFGSALADMADGGSDDAAIGALVQETADAEMLDAFVVAYRAHPSLLARLASRRDVEAVLRRVLVASNDGALARRAGIELPAPPAAATTDGLTRREAEVLGLLAEGLSNAEIARRLVIAESTAKLHVHHILTKLGVRTRTQAALLARKLPHRTA